MLGPRHERGPCIYEQEMLSKFVFRLGSGVTVISCSVFVSILQAGC